MLSFGIVDDDAVSRRMLQKIIEKGGLGEVVGTAGSGSEGEKVLLETTPDVVVIDLLMPDQDGIETIIRLKEQGYQGKYVMISQIENKEMIGKAYQAGVEFYIQKPINKIEVEAVLSKVNEQWNISRSLQEIKESLTKLSLLHTGPESVRKKRGVREIMQPILMDMGIVGDTGSRDLMDIMEHLTRHHKAEGIPPLKELYETVSRCHKVKEADVEKEGKAVEQRIRRTIMTALTHIASIGLTDYSNPKFEHYAPLYFEFQDVRMKMKEIDENCKPEKGKVNIKKFLQVLYLEVTDKMRSEY
ncbi:two-component system response regulator YcbB [Paenibacillus sp. V4I3]|uniref:response regulator n=1 Tax=unclassified Paenibacillus TaxID=185978 RepID=UPI002783B7F7|nr:MULTISPECIES: response regulator [unclassified Paenibacillus]MDQ0872938.1 two-component system response regulator YcbB [Paenibacillus sp. V4I3]MDQ0891143.1 two-component system response regulator YcbB [Paenibacillus sp. V4I9]